MSNPLSNLNSAFKILAEHVDIMPAVGRAIEDLQYTNQDEREDGFLSRQDAAVNNIIAESPNRELYKATSSLPSVANHKVRVSFDVSNVIQTILGEL